MKYRERLAEVKRWLTESGWTATAATFDYDPLADRAMQEFGYTHRDRARILVAKAARLLRGEFVKNASPVVLRSIRLDDDDWQRAAEIGNGSPTNGIRAALRKASVKSPT